MLCTAGEAEELVETLSRFDADVLVLEVVLALKVLKALSVLKAPEAVLRESSMVLTLCHCVSLAS